jgi:hypothetical protein
METNKYMRLNYSLAMGRSPTKGIYPISNTLEFIVLNSQMTKLAVPASNIITSPSLFFLVILYLVNQKENTYKREGECDAIHP